MYVIGTSPYDLIEIKMDQFISNLFDRTKHSEITHKVVHIYYGAQSQLEATIIKDIDSAKEILAKIKSNYDNIKFENSNIIGQILDREEGFKFDTSKLKIYELIPTEVE